MAEELQATLGVGKVVAAQHYLARCSGELNAVLLGMKSFEQASKTIKALTDDLSKEMAMPRTGNELIYLEETDRLVWVDGEAKIFRPREARTLASPPGGGL